MLNNTRFLFYFYSSRNTNSFDEKISKNLPYFLKHLKKILSFTTDDMKKVINFIKFISHKEHIISQTMVQQTQRKRWARVQLMKRFDKQKKGFIYLHSVEKMFHGRSPFSVHSTTSKLYTFLFIPSRPYQNGENLFKTILTAKLHHRLRRQSQT